MAAGEAGVLEAVERRLSELSTLESDWDSYGALSPSPGSWMMAKRVIIQMVARFGGQGVPTDIMPIADGGIQVEWRSRDRELALNAAPYGSWSYLLIERASGERACVERYGLTDDEAVALAIGYLSQ